MELLWWNLPALLLVLGIVELLKRVGFPSKFAGLLAVGLGAAGGVAAYLWGDSELASAAVNGLVVGLAAAGLWSTGKHTLGG